MQGYHVDRLPYLTGSQKYDTILFYMVLVVLFNVATVAATQAIWENNPGADWASMDEKLPIYTMAWPLVTALVFYALQIFRMLYYYAIGWENWASDQGQYDTFSVDPLKDIVRALSMGLSVLMGMVAISAVTVATSTRDTALAHAHTASWLLAIVSIGLPFAIFGMQQMRKHQLRKLETYRELGGDD
jgi:hypothetical protein